MFRILNFSFLAKSKTKPGNGKATQKKVFTLNNFVSF